MLKEQKIMTKATKGVSLLSETTNYFHIFSVTLYWLGILSMCGAIILGIFNKNFVSLGRGDYFSPSGFSYYTPNFIVGIVLLVVGMGIVLCILAKNPGEASFRTTFGVILGLFAFITSIFFGANIFPTSEILPQIYFWMLLGGFLAATFGVIAECS